MSGSFFNEQLPQSEVKALLVKQYFDVWANIMISTQKKYPQYTQKIAYIDLFAGPGRYKDGQKSTPLAVIELALQNRDIRDRLVAIFNDKDPDNTSSLRQALQELPGIETLRYEPIVWNFEVGEDIVERLESTKLVPTLFFVDPWGYKGLSLRLINAVVKDFGCDCIFFFNYNRINMGISNDAVLPHMEALFGKGKAAELRTRLEGVQSRDRELFIVNELGEALRNMGAQYVLPFTFKSASGKRTSHHLIFVSKHARGYEKMKEIMARHSSTLEQGVASFDFNPVENEQLSFLYALSRPLEELGSSLTSQFAGKTLTMEEIYQRHHVGTPYIKKNYKSILTILEEQGRIQCDPPALQRPKRQGERTLSDKVKVTFPAKNGLLST